MDMVLLTALGVGGATVFGAVIGFFFKHLSHKFSDIVLSFAAGVMMSAAVLGLIMPSLEYGGKYGLLITVPGIFIGALCLNLIDKIVPHLHKLAGPDIEAHNNHNLSKVLLFVTAIAIHNLPEGIAAHELPAQRAGRGEHSRPGPCACSHSQPGPCAHSHSQPGPCAHSLWRRPPCF